MTLTKIIKMIRGTFIFEWRRILSRRNALKFLLLTALLWYCVFFSVSEYKTLLKEKEHFLSYEKMKFSMYLTYDQYGSSGFRIIAIPAKLSIFFNSYNFFNMESDISTNEVVNINSQLKGGNFFKTIIGYDDFSGILYLLGTILMVYFGVNTFPSRKYLKNLAKKRYILYSIFLRCIILNLIFALILSASILFAYLSGIDFSNNDITIYFQYSVFLLLFLDLFFFVGVLIAILLSFRRNAILWGSLIWFLIIILVPEIQKIYIKKTATEIQRNESVNTRKLEGLYGYESKFFKYAETIKDKSRTEKRKLIKEYILKNYLKILEQNKEIEMKLMSSMKKIMNKISNHSLLSPSTYHTFLIREISSKGNTGYISFLNHVINIKEAFFHFYIENRYADYFKVRPFLETEKQVFYLESRMPGDYLSGILILLAYMLLVFIVIMKVIDYKLKDEKGLMKEISITKIRKGELHFLQYKDIEIKEGILNYLRFKTNAEVISPINRHDFPSDITLKSLIKLNCKLEKLPYSATDTYTKYFGISENDLRMNVKSAPYEVILKIYLTSKLIKKSDLYVFDEILKGQSKEFEKKCLQIAPDMKKRILYIGKEMKQEGPTIEEFDVFLVNPKLGVTFR